jgi:hypothetical protein
VNGHNPRLAPSAHEATPIESLVLRRPAAATKSFNGKPKATASDGKPHFTRMQRRRLRLAVKRRCAHRACIVRPKTLRTEFVSRFAEGVFNSRRDGKGHLTRMPQATAAPCITEFVSRFAEGVFNGKPKATASDGKPHFTRM